MCSLVIQLIVFQIAQLKVENFLKTFGINTKMLNESLEKKSIVVNAFFVVYMSMKMFLLNFYFKNCRAFSSMIV